MRDLLEVSQSPSLFSDPRTSSVYSFFGKDKPKLGKRVGFGEKVAQQIAEETAAEIRRGTRVRHPSLGEGSVLEIGGSDSTARSTSSSSTGVESASSSPATPTCEVIG